MRHWRIDQRRIFYICWDVWMQDISFQKTVGACCVVCGLLSAIFITGWDVRINTVAGWISVLLKLASQCPLWRGWSAWWCTLVLWGTWVCLPVDPPPTEQQAASAPPHDDETVPGHNLDFQFCKLDGNCRKHISASVFPPNLCSWQYFHYSKRVKVVPVFPFYCLKLHILCGCDYLTIRTEQRDLE